MNLNIKKIEYFFLIILIFLIAYQNYHGVLSHYIFAYEYISNQNIFTQNIWTEYWSKSTQFLPLRLLNNFGFELNNDYHFFILYLINGIISVYFLNKIIFEFLNIKDFYTRFILLICCAFAEFVIFKSVWSSTFLPFIHLQTTLATQLIYPFFYTILSQRFFFASILSSLLIFIHFTIAWFPTLVFSIFVLYKTKFKSLKILFLLIPFSAFLLLYYFNFDNFDKQSEYSLTVIRMILDRSAEESVLFLQPINRIIYFIFSLLIFFYLNNKIIKNNNLSIFFSIVFYLCISVSIFGALWTSIGHEYFPMISLSYLYFVRSILSYHIVFILLISYFFFIQKISPIKKLTIFIIIYTLGKTYFSFKGILISLSFLFISISLEHLLAKIKIKINIDKKHIFYSLIFYIFITQVYLINKNNVREFDRWSFLNLNDWTQSHTEFSNKSDNYKDNLFKLRKCKDYLLIPIIQSNNKLKYYRYFNLISHKSIFAVDNASVYHNYDEFILNKKRYDKVNKLLQDIESKKDFELLMRDDFWDKEVFLFDYSIYEKYFDDSIQLKKNYINKDNQFFLYTKSNTLKDEIINCY